MKRLLPLAFCAFIIHPFSSRAQSVPQGALITHFPYTVSKLLADPVRQQVYMLSTDINSLVVINTSTLQVVATLPVGSNPLDLALSPDNSTLYVANAGSTASAVTVVDLGSLTVRTSFALPVPATGIAAGLAGRIYASTSSNSGGGLAAPLYQLDGTTGTVEATFGDPFDDRSSFLQASPDGKTLFVASSSGEPGSLESFDVSTAAPTLLQTNSDASENDYQLILSHNGKYLCLPSGGGNPGGPASYSTVLFATPSVTSFYGGLINGDYPGPLAFSPDDTLVYQAVGQATTVQIFSTSTFNKISEVPIPYFGSDGYPPTIKSIITDHTGSYLFLAENGDFVSDEGDLMSAGQLVVLSTGTGTLTPPVPLVHIASADNEVTQGSGGTATITISRAGGDFTKKLIVFYSLTGTAENGVDYELLKEKVKIKANQSTGTIKIVPENLAAGSTKKIKLNLVSAPTYELRDVTKAKIKILPAGG